jgi:hypothetical protein
MQHTDDILLLNRLWCKTKIVLVRDEDPLSLFDGGVAADSVEEFT